MREYNVPDSWYYETTNKSINWTIEGKNRFCNIQGCHFNPLGNHYMFRDTHKNSIPKIIRYRLSQRNCKSTDFVDGMPCSWYYVYYPVLLQNFTSFACVDLDTQGTWVPSYLIDKQKRAFFCYFDSKVYYWK